MDKKLMFSSIKTERIYEQIVSQIHELIKEGHLKPGTKLPGERKMAESLNCSRSSLREALRVLESDGIIVSKAGGGRYIQNVKENISPEYEFDSVNLLEKSAILYFLEAREVLEPKIVKIAIERASNKDIEELGKVLKEMEERFKYPDEEVKNDSIFHLKLAEMTGNFVFVSMLEMNLNMIRKIRRKTLITSSRYRDSLEEHKEIFEAIKIRDSNKAEKLILYHLQNLRTSIIESK